MITIHEYAELPIKNCQFYSEIESWIYSFAKELNNYVEKSYDPEPWRLYTEAPMTGFLINGIIRQDADLNKTVLQEFCVNEEKSFMGRCDFLLIAENDAYIVETKFVKNPTYGIKEWSEKNYISKLKEVNLQVKNYYDSEAESYRHFNNVILVSLIFYYVQFPSEALQSYIKLSPNDYCRDDKFYFLLQSNEQDNKYSNETCLEIFGAYEVVSKLSTE
jgi:hypothetical protein